MPKSSQRSQQMSELIQHEIAKLMHKEIRDPRLQHISIVHVNLSPDFKLAKVYYSLWQISGIDDKALQETKIALEKAKGYIRHLVSQNLTMRYTPQIEFIYDESIIEAEKISKLIDKVMAEDKNLDATSKDEDEQDQKKNP